MVEGLKKGSTQSSDRKRQMTGRSAKRSVYLLREREPDPGRAGEQAVRKFWRGTNFCAGRPPVPGARTGVYPRGWGSPCAIDCRDPFGPVVGSGGARSSGRSRTGARRGGVRFGRATMPGYRDSLSYSGIPCRNPRVRQKCRLIWVDFRFTRRQIGRV
jgi:hypothetical protein